MNQSSLKHIPDSDIFFIFIGTFFYLAPLTIPLSVIVMIQNIVIFVNYYKDRNKLIPSLFMGIALSDILRAQGELVLSVISILAYTGLVDVTVLYKSLVYYMLTALPGVNWSKVFNLVMAVAITVKVVNPFSRLDTKRVKRVATYFCSVILLLHILDVIVVIVVEFKPSLVYFDAGKFAYLYFYLLLGMVFPGGVTTFSLYCVSDMSRCGHSKTDSQWVLQEGFVGSVVVVFFLGPSILVLVCMIIQVIYLRRSLQEEEATLLMPNTSRHVSTTVLLTSVLFFICNVIYALVALGAIIKFHSKMQEKHFSDGVLADIGP